ncbi:MAG: APC family permease, partial [Pirellulaceae bacterium]
MKKPSADDGAITERLSPWDGISIIIGIVVGVSIYKAPSLIFNNVAGPWQAMGVWVLGGVLSLIGALCYAELTTTYPRSGGDYVYLTRAFGRWVGFLFGWAQLVAILTGSIGAMAYVFADYAIQLMQGSPWDVGPSFAAWLAAGAVALLTAVNVLGVLVGKTVQNVLTLAKLLGVSGIVVAGFVWGGSEPLTVTQPIRGPGLGLAMIFVLYTYGGWNDAAFVAAEVKNRKKNLPRVLLLGTGSIMVIYLLVNAGYMWGLGFEGVRASAAPAADLLQKAVGDWGAKGMCLLVMISALGAVNGMIFTGSRVYMSLGVDHRVFAALGRWHPTLKSPVWALLISAAVCLLMITTVGTEPGRNTLDNAMALFGLPGLPWNNYGGGFDTLVSATAPVFWTFFLLTGLSLFALREIDRDVERPFSVPFYPFTPFVFCVTSVYMLYSSLTYAKQLALIGMVPLALGVPLYFI